VSFVYVYYITIAYIESEIGGRGYVGRCTRSCILQLQNYTSLQTKNYKPLSCQLQYSGRQFKKCVVGSIHRSLSGGGSRCQQVMTTVYVVGVIGGRGGMDHGTNLARSSKTVFIIYRTILVDPLVLSSILVGVPVVTHNTTGSTQTSGMARCHANATGYT